MAAAARSVTAVEGLRIGRKVRAASLEVRAGQIVGLTGLLGSGRTEVARAVFGADPPDAGAIRIGGKPAAPKEPREAIHEAALVRLRPIMMTTAAAVLGAVPLAIGIGQGASLRQPLGITVMGGLILSQVFTLYTTPVIYLYLDRLRARLARWSATLPWNQAGSSQGQNPGPGPNPGSGAGASA